MDQKRRYEETVQDAGSSKQPKLDLDSATVENPSRTIPASASLAPSTHSERQPYYAGIVELPSKESRLKSNTQASSTGGSPDIPLKLFQHANPRPSGPLISFPLFQCLPVELQLNILDEAITNLLNPRIVMLDVATSPFFDPVSHGVSLGWEPTVVNRTELHRENPIQLAYTLIDTCASGARLGSQFLDNMSDVPAPPRHCQAMQGLDLSLWGDIFWLPDDLLGYLNARGATPAHQNIEMDEREIRRLMVSIDSMVRMLAWAQGRISEEDEKKEAGVAHCIVLDWLLGNFRGCEQIVVLADRPGACAEKRHHLPWDAIWFVHPSENHRYLGPNPAWKIAPEMEARCSRAWHDYDLIIRGNFGRWPQLAFAFVK